MQDSSSGGDAISHPLPRLEGWNLQLLSGDLKILRKGCRYIPIYDTLPQPPSKSLSGYIQTTGKYYSKLNILAVFILSHKLYFVLIVTFAEFI